MEQSDHFNSSIVEITYEKLDRERTYIRYTDDKNNENYDRTVTGTLDAISEN